MKKLGKKNQEVIETIEAYSCACSGKMNCWDFCPSGENVQYASLNNYYFNVAYKGVKKQ